MPVSYTHLPRIITNKENIHKMMRAVDDPHNGLTLCTGSLGTDLNNDLPDIIRSLPGRIHFAHVRNLHHFAPGVFEEAAHLSSDGSFDMYEIMKALHDIHFEGPIRPDHGRTVWGEVCMPGYGPVSYTHLDVYKRQVYDGGAGFLRRQPLRLPADQL